MECKAHPLKQNPDLTVRETFRIAQDIGSLSPVYRTEIHSFHPQITG